MKEMISTNLHVLMRTALAMALSLCCTSLAMAQQCQMNCNDDVQVSLNQECSATLLYDLMLEDPDNPNTCSPNGPSAYTVIIMEANGDPRNEAGTPALLNCDDIGETLTVKVKHWASGNSCWGTVSVEDKIAPIIQCREISLWCNQDYSIAALGEPVVTDNCDNYPNATDCDVVTLEHLGDRWEDLDCESDGVSAIIYREWRATDASGNVSTCEEVIIFERFDLCVGVDEHWDCIPNPELELPEHLTDDNAIDCESECADIFRRICDGTATDEDIAASYDCAGFPSVHDRFLGEQPGSSSAYLCEVNVGHDDTCIEVCDDASFKVIRDFRIVDWCTGDILEYTQIIKIEDHATDIICPADLTVGTNLGVTACGYFGNLPAATPNESCADFTIQTKIFGQVQGNHGSSLQLLETIDGNGGLPSQPLLIPEGCEGEFIIRYEISDACHNHDFCEMTLTVTDDDAPTPVCDEITQVTLDAFPLADECNVGGGTAIVYASTFDDGSHDNCSEDLLMEARRMGTSAWGDFVTFDCNDCGESIMVEFRVTDECGNVSESCMVEVLVDDKTAPIITCPENLTVACTDIADSQNNEQVKQLLDSLGDDVLATAEDNCCVDRIECQIIQNATNECNVGNIRVRYTAFDLGWPEVNSSNCIFTLTLEDNTPISVQFPPDVTLFCDDTDGMGFGEGTDPSDLNPPFDTVNISGDDCELLAVNHFDEFFPIADGACFKILRRWVVIDWCAYDPNGPQTPENGYYTSTQVIKVLDNDAPIVPEIEDQVVCIFDGCSVDVDICRPDAEDCVPADFLTYTYEGDLGSGTIAGECVTIPNVGIGTYEVVINTFDNCGNATKSTYEVKVEDCKKPTPYCVNGLVIELMPTTGMVETWASDFDAGSFDNCPGDLQLSFSDDVSDIGREFTCDDLGTQEVILWVTDEAGNQDFCVTFVIIQDNMGACPSDPNTGGLVASGTVQTEMNASVQDVMVAVNGGMDEMIMTDASGAFNFNLPMNGDYSITAERDDNYLNGVTTFDLVKLRKHILGTELLDTPYKMIAADINNSSSISTFDMVELRKLILQINDEFPNNTSWRFVDADYVFDNPANPWTEPFPEVINYNDLTASDLAADFVAIKIGDLNDSATANELLGAEDRSSNGQLVFNVADQALKAGQTYTVDFSADLADVEGYQFTLNFDKNAIQLSDIVEGVATAENFGTTLVNEGAITTSWNGTATDKNAFALTFTATANAQLSEVLSISSRYTVAEAYKANDLLDVAIQFSNNAPVSTGFALYQNAPNPFSSVTNISFNLAEAGTATLRVHDVTGKVITMVRGDYAQGLNTITMSKAQLNVTGVLYYTLETADAMATRKMIVIK